MLGGARPEGDVLLGAVPGAAGEGEGEGGAPGPGAEDGDPANAIRLMQAGS